MDLFHSVKFGGADRYFLTKTALMVSWSLAHLPLWAAGFNATCTIITGPGGIKVLNHPRYVNNGGMRSYLTLKRSNGH